MASSTNEPEDRFNLVCTCEGLFKKSVIQDAHLKLRKALVAAEEADIDKREYHDSILLWVVRNHKDVRILRRMVRVYLEECPGLILGNGAGGRAERQFNTLLYATIDDHNFEAVKTLWSMGLPWNIQNACFQNELSFAIRVGAGEIGIWLIDNGYPVTNLHLDYARGWLKSTAPLRLAIEDKLASQANDTTG
ncbi:Uu.00g086680.m01.CDS01 [Anthostomella pinea]|uniref:Uu.00g086680.m01.CDS01 n=1 Tax=Anthostomella pinea TaxID=933095 RepID=A0AAI8VMU7_9PEZI|nr:Uu.00g086680.m01.CDS01 [Anthostomella pinea]